LIFTSSLFDGLDQNPLTYDWDERANSQASFAARRVVYSSTLSAVDPPGSPSPDSGLPLLPPKSEARKLCCEEGYLTSALAGPAALLLRGASIRHGIISREGTRWPKPPQTHTRLITRFWAEIGRELRRKEGRDSRL